MSAETQRRNASFASEVFAASVVPRCTATVGTDAFQSAYELRKAVLRRGRFPVTAPPPVVSSPLQAAAGNEQSTTTGQLVLHASAAATTGGALIRGTPSSSAATASTSVVGVSSEYGKRARDKGDELAIISIDAEVLRNKTRAREEAVGEREKPHARWRLRRVIAGHSGAVFAVAVAPTNEWFATGSDDTTIRIYDLATGKLKVQPLTGHTAAVRALGVSKHSPHFFSGSEDNSVKIWDLETNRVVGSFFGHKGAVTSIAIHPDLNVVGTGSYDKIVRLWDVRTKEAVYNFRGHEREVVSVAMQNCEPQLVSGSEDAFVYLWDLKAGKALTRLTRHKKAVHSITIHHSEATMATVGEDNVRKWKLPAGEFFTNMTSSAIPNAPQSATWRTSCVNADDVFFVGARNGQMRFYDWGSHRLYQHMETTSVKGTLPGEHGIRCSTFDVSGTLLLTGEGDKTVKVWHQPKQ